MATKKEYSYNSVNELRSAFWEFCDEQGIKYQNTFEFEGDLACMFLDWTNAVWEDGEISDDLFDEAGLYNR